MRTIVIGSLNTDLIATGVTRFPKPGEHVYGKAAAKLQTMGIENVLITHGAHGAYLFAEREQVYIPIPDIEAGKAKDETGCGDQTMATVV